MPLAGQAFPPLHTLGHELTALFTGVVATVLFFASAAIARRMPGRRGAALWRCLFVALASGLAGLSVVAAANALGPHCQLGRGVPFFAVTFAPAAALASVAGCLLGARRARLRAQLGLYACAVALSLAHDAAQVAFGPRIVPVDFFLGDLLAFNQRAGMQLTEIHLYQRGIVLLFTFFLWNLGLWRQRRRLEPQQAEQAAADLGPSPGLRAALSGLVLAVLIGWAGSHVGMGWGDGRVRSRLGESRESDHFVFHFEDDPWVLSRIDPITRTAEWYWRYLTELWQIEPQRKVRVYVYRDRDAANEYTAIASAHAGIRQVHATVQEALSTSLLHELVHALHIELDPTPRILLSRGMLEGTAVAIDGAYFRVPEAHELQAGAMRSGKLPPAASFMSPLGFREHYETAAYEAAGSFLGFLMLQYGTERFLVLQRTFNIAAAFGKDLEQLDTEWRAFLATVPVAAAARLRASELFDPGAHPGYRDEACPKLGRVPPREVREARRHRDAGEYGAALPRFLALGEREARAEWALEAAGCLAAEGDPAAAASFLDGALDRAAAADYERAAMLEAAIDYRMRAEDWPGLAADLDRRDAEGLTPDAGDEMVARCLRDPTLRDRVARALTSEDEYERRAILEGLVRERPGSAPLLYLLAARGIQRSAPLATRARAALAAASSGPEGCELLGDTLDLLLRSAFAEKDYSLAEEICNVILTHCVSGLRRYGAELGLARLDLERRERPAEGVGAR